ncbi:MAG TPA: SNF2-related protein, partial [Candidatus Acidoferrum sp.]|nr:SNF2-related protein [Candidatus Acidoferrum sp.]
MNIIYLELTPDVQRIGVKFKYNEEDVAKIKRVPGRHWDPDERFWTVPMDMKTARLLRELYGDALNLGPALTLWAKDEVKKERRALKLINATDAELEHVPEVIEQVIAGRPIEHPTIPPDHALRRKRPERPYQRADIKMMSLGSAINANDVGTGKTLEVLGALYEAGVASRPILIVAPKRSLVNVWQTEFERLTGIECWTSESPKERGHLIALFASNEPRNVALALIADDIRVEKYYAVKGKSSPPTEFDPLHACKDYQGNWYRFSNPTQKVLFQIEFGAFIIDEFHDTGLPNRKSLFHIGAQQIRADFKWPMSGTPIGGKPRRLWPILNFIDKRQYTSEWRWIDEWLEVTEEKVYVKGGRGSQRTVRTVGGIRPGAESEFYDAHRKHMVRRTKKDALPGIPDAIELIIPTPMEGAQLQDYGVFNDEHEIVLGKKRLSGSIVLAQYTRLRQMANSRLEWDKFYTKPIAAKNSCKFEHLLERLDENGIRADDWEPGARAYVGVNDVSYMELTAEFL